MLTCFKGKREAETLLGWNDLVIWSFPMETSGSMTQQMQDKSYRSPVPFQGRGQAGHCGHCRWYVCWENWGDSVLGFTYVKFSDVNHVTMLPAYQQLVWSSFHQLTQSYSEITYLIASLISINTKLCTSQMLCCYLPLWILLRTCCMPLFFICRVHKFSSFVDSLTFFPIDLEVWRAKKWLNICMHVKKACK